MSLCTIAARGFLPTMMSRILHNPGSRRIRFASHPRLVINLTALAGLALATILTPAQTPPRPAHGAQTTPTKQAFEAASIHIVDPHSSVDHNTPNDASNQPQTFPANRWTMHYIQMISLLCAAYSEIECGHVVDGPPWLRTNEMHYDLTAKVEGNAMLTKDQMKPMLRTLLEERFHLKVHSEHKIVPGYALVIAKGGPKLTIHTSTLPSAQFFSGFEFKFQNVSAEYVAKLIGWGVKQPVVDKTGLTGMYDVDLKFAPEEGPLKDDPRFANLPSIFTAVQEQLGLKLVREKVPGDYIIIDHVDKIPTEN